MRQSAIIFLVLCLLTLSACAIGQSQTTQTAAPAVTTLADTLPTLTATRQTTVADPVPSPTIPATTDLTIPDTTGATEQPPASTEAEPSDTTPASSSATTVPATAAPVTTEVPITTTKVVTTAASTTTKPTETATPTTTVPITTTQPVTTPAPAGPEYPSVLSWDTLFPIRNDGHVSLISSNAGGFSNETAENLFDSDLSTKLCTATTGYTVVWKLDTAMPIGGYSLSTANDTARYGRLPTSWTLEASADGKQWTLVSDIANGRLSQTDYTEFFFPFSSPDDYQYFRFTLRSPGGQTQMAEITLYSRDLPQTPAMEQVSGEASANSTYARAGMELVKNAIADYYDRATHTVHGQPSSGTSSVWGAASFLEALAEAYRTNPTDAQIYRVYVDVLDHAMTAYKINGKITTTTGTYTVSYYNATRGSSGDYYYDDDAWICLQYLNAYTLLGEEGYLRRAQEMLEFFWTGWDEVQGGGIYWDKSFSSKNICADGPIAIAFLSAYEMTGKAEYLEKGKLIYEWCRDVLLQNNLYSDNINTANGSINTWKAAYNQGTMLCVGSLLYRITGESRYLTETRATYNATVSHMFRVSGSNVSMNGNPIFKAWCIGWLERGFLLFESIDPNGATKGTDYMAKVLDKTLATKNADGYYDPYFCTGDWSGESTTDVLQPSGVACTLLLVGLCTLN